MKTFFKSFTSPVAVLTLCAALISFASCDKEEFTETDFSFTVSELRQSKTFVWEQSSDGVLRCTDQQLKGLTVTSANRTIIQVTSNDQNFSGVSFHSSDESIIKLYNVTAKSCELIYTGDGSATITMTAGGKQKVVTFESKLIVPLEGVNIKVGGRNYLVPVGTDANPSFLCLSTDGIPAGGGEDLVITGLKPENSSYRYVLDFLGASIDGTVSYDDVTRQHYGSSVSSFCSNGHESNFDFSELEGRKMFFDGKAIDRGYLQFVFKDPRNSASPSTKCYAEMSYEDHSSWDDDGLSFEEIGGRTVSYEFEDYARVFDVKINNSKNLPLSVEVTGNEQGWIKYLTGNDGNTFQVYVADSKQSSSRQATVKVYSPGKVGGGCSVCIVQKGREEGTIRAGLVDLYNKVNGPNWNHSDNWCTDKPIIEWYGLTPSKAIELNKFGMSGKAYYGTGNLWSIKLVGNNMNKGVIPESFWKACRNFESIKLYDNYLVESTFPDFVWNDNLKVLDLQCTFMSVPLSSAMANARNLEHIEIMYCAVNGPLPEEITTLTHLIELRMAGCGITGTLPQNLAGMKSLEKVDLGCNTELCGNLPDSFYDMQNIRTFCLSYSKVGGTISSKIANLKYLESFSIYGCEFEGTVPEELGTISRMFTWSLDGNYFEKIPEFVRYRGNGRKWQSGGFQMDVACFQRKKSDGRPDGYIRYTKECFSLPDVCVDGVPVKTPGWCIADPTNIYKSLPFPVWANIRFGNVSWTHGKEADMKYPQYPYADDLQYPATEYYFDGKDWRHPNYQYPAREYRYDGNAWIHDPSCPWDKEYVE